MRQEERERQQGKFIEMHNKKIGAVWDTTKAERVFTIKISSDIMKRIREDITIWQSLKWYRTSI